MANSVFYPPIGLSGYARAGKDSLCVALIEIFKERYNLEAKRFSIAGDCIRKDLDKLVSDKTDLSVYTNNDKEKTLLRPLFVEYGRLMRNTTKGRYFIEKLSTDKTFRKNNISIITDIRYTEYPKDEVWWLKDEVKGILFYIEREGLKPANNFELANGKIIKSLADQVICTPEYKILKIYKKEIKKIALELADLYITTFLPDISPLSNMS
jgi:hypothetical protein